MPQVHEIPFDQPEKDGSLTAFVKALEAEAAESEFDELVELVEVEGLQRGEFTSAIIQMLTLMEHSQGDESELLDLVMGYQPYDLPVLLRVCLDITYQMTCRFAQITGMTSAELIQRMALVNAAHWSSEGGEHADEEGQGGSGSGD